MGSVTKPDATHATAAAIRSPFDRLEGESAQAFARFVTYRNLPAGQRALSKVGVSAQLAARWSRKFSWVQRASEFDSWLLNSNESLGLRATREAQARHLALGAAVVDKAFKSLPRIKVTSADSFVTLAEFGTELTRRTLGLDAGAVDGANKTNGDITVNVHGVTSGAEILNNNPHVARRKTYEEISGTRLRDKSGSKGELDNVINHEPSPSRITARSPALLSKSTASLRESADAPYANGDGDVIDISVIPVRKDGKQ